MVELNVKAVQLSESKQLKDLMEKGFRAFLISDHIEPTSVLNQLQRIDDMVILFLSGIRDAGSLYDAIGETQIFAKLFKSSEISLHKSFSSGIYEWPRLHRDKILLCVPELHGEPGNFLLTEQVALYNYENLKSHYFFDNRDSDEVTLLQKQFQNSVRKNILIGVYSNDDNFPSKKQYNKLRSHGAHLIFKSK